ncbi:MAG: acetate--CoA ligase family protein [Thermoanaerobaculaceae bacterium]|nr:acetate--CoA ligase family protein [Thermoanaerobaculaceae bacterium]
MREALQAILCPSSLALVGVSSRSESLSGVLLANLYAAGFTGVVYPVNPKVRSLRTLRCFPSVAAIPEPVDCAIVMVPRDGVAATVEECLAAGVKGIVVITAGFREAGSAGAEVERELVRRVRAAGAVMVGPNCMGVMNLDPAVRLDATFSPAPAQPGGVAFASHSGALGVALIEAVREIGLGFSQFVSLGNSADVNVCDLLEVWEEHEPTRAIMLYLEEIEQPRRFLQVASRITRHKPILALKSGRTGEGQRAASSHTGALAAGDTGVEAILRQAGVRRCRSLAELLDLARLFERARPVAGRRVAVVSNAGGPAIIATDALVDEGLELATLQEETRAELRSFLPAEAAVANPVDMLPSATGEHYRRAVEVVTADPGVDAAVVITVTPPMIPVQRVAEQVAAAAAPTPKPVIPVFMTSPRFFEVARSMAGLPPVYAAPESAVRALAALVQQQETATRPPWEPSTAATPEASVVQRARLRGASFLSPEEAFSLLEGIGVSVAPFRCVARGEEVTAAAAQLGYPVALKAYGGGIVHKSELGAVAVGLNGPAEVEAAVAAMRARLAAAGVAAEGFLVQAMVSGGREVIVGLTRDPVGGPLVMLGLGGVAVEVWRDVSFRPAPVSAAEAAAMLDELRGAALLGPFRGHPPADTAALCEAVARFSTLGAVAGIAEGDVNPLLVLPQGQGCVAVDVRIAIGP